MENREILFRGKRKDNGEWIEGFLISENQINTFIEKEHIEFNSYLGVTEVEAYQVLESIEINPDTVGQFTGLKDKNGKKIFEGDICGCFCNTQRFVVKYCEERCGYFFDDCVSSGYSDASPECLGNLRDTIEVIGNIYDNPELLEVEE